MKLIIFKGFHYSTFLPRIYRIKKYDNISKSVKVIFDESCKYDIEEKSCVNKLWGFSMGLFGVHKDSYRFGWTYNKETNKIDIWNYIYINKKLYKHIISSCDFNKEYEFSLYIKELCPELWNVKLYKDGEMLSAMDIPTDNKRTLLELGFYFGGNTRSPHKMCITFVRI